MQDDVICLKFTPKPRLHEMFLEPLPPSCCFHKVIPFISVPWENVLLKRYKSALLKAKLGGEIGYSDVNTHKALLIYFFI